MLVSGFNIEEQRPIEEGFFVPIYTLQCVLFGAEHHTARPSLSVVLFINVNALDVNSITIGIEELFQIVLFCPVVHVSEIYNDFLIIFIAIQRPDHLLNM